MRWTSTPLWIALGSSLVAHALVAIESRPEPAVLVARGGHFRSLEIPLARARAPRERRSLLATAEKLPLGEFVVRAQAIDARERYSAIDEERALELYRQRVRRLALALADAPPSRAVPEVFGDLHYDLTENRMAAALLAGGGNCEALSLLIASAMHDAGRPGSVDLRYWGGSAPGRPAHLAPVLGEHDLATGAPVVSGGRRFSASEIVERYADASPRGLGHAFARYPDNADPYPGATPIYAERAVSPATSRAPVVPALSGVDWPAAPTRCWANLHDLTVPELDVVLSPEGVFSVELHALEGPHELESDGWQIGQFEQALATTRDSGERLLGLACTAIVYDRAAVRFAARSKTALANKLLERRTAALREAALIAKTRVLPRPSAALAELDAEATVWMLVVLPELEAALFDFAFVAQQGKPTTLLIALIAHPRTRSRALRAAERLPKSTQLILAAALFYPTYTGYRESLLGPNESSELARVARLLASVHHTGSEVRDLFLRARLDASWLAAWDELSRVR